MTRCTSTDYSEQTLVCEEEQSCVPSPLGGDAVVSLPNQGQGEGGIPDADVCSETFFTTEPESDSTNLISSPDFSRSGNRWNPFANHVAVRPGDLLREKKSDGYSIIGTVKEVGPDGVTVRYDKRGLHPPAEEVFYSHFSFQSLISRRLEAVRPVYEDGRYRQEKVPTFAEETARNSPPLPGGEGAGGGWQGPTDRSSGELLRQIDSLKVQRAEVVAVFEQWEKAEGHKWYWSDVIDAIEELDGGEELSCVEEERQEWQEKITSIDGEIKKTQEAINWLDQIAENVCEDTLPSSGLENIGLRHLVRSGLAETPEEQLKVKLEASRDYREARDHESAMAVALGGILSYSTLLTPAGSVLRTEEGKASLTARLNHLIALGVIESDRLIVTSSDFSALWRKIKLYRPSEILPRNAIGPTSETIQPVSFEEFEAELARLRFIELFHRAALPRVAELQAEIASLEPIVEVKRAWEFTKNFFAGVVKMIDDPTTAAMIAAGVVTAPIGEAVAIRALAAGLGRVSVMALRLATAGISFHAVTNSFNYWADRKAVDWTPQAFAHSIYTFAVLGGIGHLYGQMARATYFHLARDYPILFKTLHTVGGFSAEVAGFSAANIGLKVASGTFTFTEDELIEELVSSTQMVLAFRAYHLVKGENTPKRTYDKALELAAQKVLDARETYRGSRTPENREAVLERMRVFLQLQRDAAVAKLDEIETAHAMGRFESEDQYRAARDAVRSGIAYFEKLLEPLLEQGQPAERKAASHNVESPKTHEVRQSPSGLFVELEEGEDIHFAAQIVIGENPEIPNGRIVLRTEHWGEPLPWTDELAAQLATLAEWADVTISVYRRTGDGLAVEEIVPEARLQELERHGSFTAMPADSVAQEKSGMNPVPGSVTSPQFVTSLFDAAAEEIRRDRPDLADQSPAFRLAVLERLREWNYRFYSTGTYEDPKNYFDPAADGRLKAEIDAIKKVDVDMDWTPFAIGPRAFESASTGRKDGRFYLAVASGHAADVYRYLFEVVDADASEKGYHFSGKLSKHASDYGRRADVMVVYWAKEHSRPLLSALIRMAREHPGWLMDRTPFQTAPVTDLSGERVPGLSFASNASPLEVSFGHHVSEILTHLQAAIQRRSSEGTPLSGGEIAEMYRNLCRGSGLNPEEPSLFAGDESSREIRDLLRTALREGKREIIPGLTLDGSRSGKGEAAIGEAASALVGGASDAREEARRIMEGGQIVEMVMATRDAAEVFRLPAVDKSAALSKLRELEQGVDRLSPELETVSEETMRQTVEARFEGYEKFGEKPDFNRPDVLKALYTMIRVNDFLLNEEGLLKPFSGDQMPVLVEDILLGRLTRPGSIGSCHPMTVLQIHLSRRLGIAVLPIHAEQHVAVAIPQNLAPDLIFEPAIGKFTPISYYQRSFRIAEGATGEGLDRLLPQAAAPLATFDSADFLAAMPASERLAALYPEDRGHLINHARACLNKGDLQQAINTYGQVLKTNPRDLEALLGVAGILYQVDRLEEASRYFTAALQIIEARNKLADELNDPLPRPANNVVETVYANAALFENRLRQVDPANEPQHLVNARQFMLKAAEANPKATEPHQFIIDWTWELAVRLFSEGKAEDAVALYEEGLPVLFDNPGYAVDNVVAIAASGDRSRAEGLLTLAALEPAFATALESRIAELKARGLDELARQIEALGKEGIDSPVHAPAEREVIPGFTLAHLGDLFRRKGKEVTLVEGEYLMRKGEVGNRMYWIAEGTLTVHVGDKTIDLGPGNVVGEMAVIEERGIRTADVSAKTNVRLLELTDEQVRHLVTAGTKQDLQALSEDRKKVWPSVPVAGDEVRLINLEEKFAPLVDVLLTNETLRHQLLATAGIDPEKQEVHFEDAQFGGQGTIKYVVRLGLLVDGKPRSLGIRFYGTRLFRNTTQANEAAKEEVAEFKAFQQENGTAVVIHDYIPADSLGAAEIHFLTAGIGGFSVGEFIVTRSLSDIPGDTGVKKEHLQDTVETVVRGWFLRRGTNGREGAFGPVIGDLKLENFVLDDQGERGQKIKYLDLGDVQWVDLTELVLTRLSDFLGEHLPEISPAERSRLLADGLVEGVLGYIEGKIVSADLPAGEKIRKLQAVIDAARLIDPEGGELARAVRRIIVECERRMTEAGGPTPR